MLFKKDLLYVQLDDLVTFSDHCCIPVSYPQVLITLSFLASGSHQKSVGKDFNVNISQKSVSRVIKIVIEGLNLVLDNWIVFPSTTAQREQIKEG